MSNFLHTVKPVIQTLKPYSLKSFDFDIKLNQNESPYDLPPEFKKEILEEFSRLPWNRYPSYTNHRLTEKLAAFLEVEPDRVLIGNGSNELLQMLISLIVPARSKILLVTPTFAIYQQLARLAEAEISEIEFASDWSFPVEMIISYLKERPVNLCILCSPNSPTGVNLQQGDLMRI
ncbi:aminotransferase class I/II-fold pyridoxal phosphate-dependent enzyme, partial [candidate division KSB1 bacterium]|nr:aminotransferase class I/II-fold pyridoxal phosphate-dependent enzyme [candidate division KSB1 bacterium]NIR71016.1 aminotransferase class I/II-fold pyridoxal phosphate-dependent enzyme [candidate division KSB1 bacterium]NIS26101.1 aminotransferase class I/II-fold pyridoxal phosphate-dependent enzyme [candidate division KSB1 bacterium]NIT72895.1 aminotransferase class I/II-fold pyridoxal phosphate-dependent enzyme [candidate division KSB1 bacterium]NIU26740.1 aminotransferase class I/II-fold